ncbi:MAG: oxidoreductase [Proteobacteria bacterium]|nr:MAG: oxidoreductase [Pseudomonadota bacterium]
MFRPASTPATEERIAKLRVPVGFAVSAFARDLGHPRMLAVGPDGEIYVTRPQQDDVLVLEARDLDEPPSRRTLVSGLDEVHGIALRGDQVYLATPTQVLAVERSARDGRARVVADGLPDGGQHPNRTLGFGPDGALYVSVGSSCNACQESNAEHATLLRVDVESGERRLFARGLRNTIGFAWHPQTQALWGMDHGTDWLGDDVPPEELNQLAEGRDYGWPFCFGDRTPDPSMREPQGDAAQRGATKAEYCKATEPPVLGTQAHAAPIGLVFYDGITFPDRYRGSAFVAMHGSWNRKPAVGYEVVALIFEGGRPVRFEPFLHGFLVEDGSAHFGRPAGVALAKDGALLVSDDVNGILYRVSYGSARIAKPE